jgi:peptidoglycan-associated lipoprotein
MSLSRAMTRRLSFASKGMAVLCLLVAVGAGCKSAPKQAEEGPVAGSDENASGDSDTGKAMGMQTLYFPYDSFVLDTTARNTLKTNIDILKANATVKVQVEGHCDERGGIQYNIALGEKRANAVRKYITDQGIAGDRVTTISYGKERPIAQGSTQDAFAKNRRANFVITSK